MRRHCFLFAAKPSRNHPEIVSTSPHRIMLSPRPDFLRARECRRHAPAGNWGCQQRMKYGRTLCVPPVACRAGLLLGGDRRVRFPRFSQVSSRHRTIRACAPRRSSGEGAFPASSFPLRRSPFALGARRRRDALARPCRHAGEPDVWYRLERRSDVFRPRFVGPCFRSAPLSRRQSHQPAQPVVRALHEHGAGAHRSSRHRFGHGEFVCALWPAHLRPRRSAPSR